MNIRKLIIFSVLAIIAIIAIVAAYFMLTRGYLTVSSNGDTVVITKLDGTEVASGASSYSGILPEGEYFVTAQKNYSGATKQQVTVSIFHNESVDLSVGGDLKARPVTNGSVSSLHKTSSGSYMYIDRTTATLYKQEDVSRTDISDGYDFYSVEWIDGTGLAYATDNSTPVLLSVSDSGSLSVLKRFTGGVIGVSASADKSGWYVTNDSSLYRVATGTNSVSSIQSFDSSIAALASTGDLVALSLSTGELFDSTLRVYNAATKTAVHEEPYTVEESPTGGIEFAFSPDGTYSSMLLNGTPYFYDKEFNEVGFPIPDTITALAWKSPTVFLYGDSGNIWQYDISKKLSTQKTSLLNYNSIQSLSTSDFFSVVNSGSVLWYEYSDTEVSDPVAALAESNILEMTSYCRLYFTAMEKPAIWVRTDAEGSDICKSQVSDYIKQITGSSLPTAYKIVSF